jgi:septin family protein
MDGKIEQRVCIKFCMKLSKFTTKTSEMLYEAFEEHSLRQTALFEGIQRFKAGRVSVEEDEHSAKQQKMLKKFENSSNKTVTEQSMSSQTPLVSVTEFARRS